MALPPRASAFLLPRPCHLTIPQYEKLLACIAHDAVAKCALKSVDELAEQGVALRKAVGIIDVLEMIDVD